MTCIQRFSDDAVQRYLFDRGADKEERYCLRLWLNDGHSYQENDYGMKDTDFLEAIRCAYYPADDHGPLFTSSFYDPRTQQYIRSLNPTRAEMRRLRKLAREGIPFDISCSGVPYGDLLTSWRNRWADNEAYFESCYEDLLERYTVPYLIRRNKAGDFLKFAEREEMKRPYRNNETEHSDYDFGSTDFDDELPF